jgi:ABC-type nickel/cobalt efflux system permease component RcnA
MGVAGGLVPSPSALLVLLGATALGRAWFGVLLVIAYGLGMAVTLTIAGLILLRAQAVLDRRGWALGRWRHLVALLPLITAGIVVLIGLLLVLRGLTTGRGLL